MRIYRGKVNRTAESIVSQLNKEGDIEVSPSLNAELEADIAAIMEDYARRDHEISTKAREQAGPSGDAGRLRRLIASEEGFKTGDDGIEWVINQIIEHFLSSPNVDEVYAEDNEIRRKIVLQFRKNFEMDEKLEAEIRGRIRHLEEGTPAWEHEYKKVRQEIELKYGLNK